MDRRAQEQGLREPGRQGAYRQTGDRERGEGVKLGPQDIRKSEGGHSRWTPCRVSGHTRWARTHEGEVNPRKARCHPREQGENPSQVPPRPNQPRRPLAG